MVQNNNNAHNIITLLVDRITLLEGKVKNMQELMNALQASMTGLDEALNLVKRGF